jgi:hypothetical protein
MGGRETEKDEMELEIIRNGIIRNSDMLYSTRARARVHTCSIKFIFFYIDAINHSVKKYIIPSIT